MRALLKLSDFFFLIIILFFPPPLQESKQNTSHFTEKETKPPVASSAGSRLALVPLVVHRLWGHSYTLRLGPSHTYVAHRVAADTDRRGRYSRSGQ